MKSPYNTIWGLPPKFEVHALLLLETSSSCFMVLKNSPTPKGKRKLFTNGKKIDWFKRMEKRSEEHTSELQSRPHLVCRLLLEKKKKKIKKNTTTKTTKKHKNQKKQKTLHN